MRDEIIHLINASSGLTQERKESLADFVRSAPGSTVSDLGERMLSSVVIAHRHLWEARLEEYFETHPPRYETHKSGYQNPPDMLNRVWGVYIDNDVLYQDRLTDYDPKLIPACYRHWQLHGRPEEDRLPPPRQKRTDAILEHVTAAAGPYTTEEIMRAIRATDRRGQRSRS